jgi:hypothetical protein
MAQEKKEVDPYLKEILEKVGEQVTLLRKSNSKLNYKDYADDVLKMSKNTYQRIEYGSGDYNIGNLVKIISHYPDQKLSKIFKKAGL